MTLHLRIMAALSPLCLLSCLNLPELSYETEHLRIGTQFETPLCQGNLARLELVVTTLEEDMGIQVEEPIEVYLWSLWDSDDAPSWCEPEAGGCYRNGKVFSDLISIEHELVHAVLDTRPARPPFWEEGAAEALQGDRTKFSSSTPSANVGANRDEVSYSTAGHFSRWLIETRGLDLYRKLLAAQGSGVEMFESTYGLSLGEAEAEYIEQAPHSYGAYISCSELELPQIDAMSWTEAIELSCAAPSVYSTSQGLYAHRVLTITERGDYEISSSGDIGRCRDDTYEAEPSLEQTELYGDVPPYTEWFPTGYVTALPAGEPRVLDLTPGRYLVTAGAVGFDVGEVRIDVTRLP